MYHCVISDTSLPICITIKNLSEITELRRYEFVCFNIFLTLHADLHFATTLLNVERQGNYQNSML